MTSLGLCRDSWHDHPKLLKQYIDQLHVRVILEIGAGPNPSIPLDIIDRRKIAYHLNDFSETELNKGDHDFLKIPGNFVDLDGLGQYDMICSRMLLEHVEDPKRLHQKVYQHLNPGGVAIHFFATLYALPTLLNLLLPESISNRMLKWGQGRDEEQHGKFPAHYHWCKGPSRGLSKKFEALGFDVLEHRGYVGHDYLKKRKGLYAVEKLYSKALLSLNLSLLCSNAILVLRKPENK